MGGMDGIRGMCDEIDSFEIIEVKNELDEAAVIRILVGGNRYYVWQRSSIKFN